MAELDKGYLTGKISLEPVKTLKNPFARLPTERYKSHERFGNILAGEQKLRRDEGSGD